MMPVLARALAILSEAGRALIEPQSRSLFLQPLQNQFVTRMAIRSENRAIFTLNATQESSESSFGRSSRPGRAFGTLAATGTFGASAINGRYYHNGISDDALLSFSGRNGSTTSFLTSCQMIPRGGDASFHNDIIKSNARHFTNSTTATKSIANNPTTTVNNGTKHKVWRRAFVAVGSNMGSPHENIAKALTLLQSNGTVRLLRTSHLRMTSPMYITDQPPFLNGAVEVETCLTPLELLRENKRVEEELGRDLSGDALRNGPRIVDLDILLFEDLDEKNNLETKETINGPVHKGVSFIMKSDKLEIPHPRMAEREFVLSPMNDLGIECNITHPLLNKTMKELLSSLQSNEQVNTGNNDIEEAVRILPLPRNRLLHFNETIIMGILNVTPDSFSDGGKYSESTEKVEGDAVSISAMAALQMEKDGAGIIDIGGESTRPGADEVAIEEELRRVLPVIKRIRIESDIPISIDTRHSRVAKAAIEAGADIVNDVSGGTHDPQMLSCVASMGVPMILMHMRGNPKTMQSMTTYNGSDGGESVVSGVISELMERSLAAEAAGIPRWLQVLDPGIGFAKTKDGNLSLLKASGKLREACGNLPFLFGPSRKGFIGKISGESIPEDRDFGTIAACLAAIQRNSEGGEYCNILRVHNVKAMKQAVLVYEAIMNAK